MRNKGSKSQSFIEYALLVAFVVGALIAMKIYMSRAVQAKFKQAGDTFGQGEQYAKGVTEADEYDDSGFILPPEGPAFYDTCASKVRRVTELEQQIDDFSGRIESFEQNAAEMEARIQELTQQAGQMRNQAADYAARAAGYREQAQQLIDLADAYQACLYGGGSGCEEFGEITPQEIADLRREAEGLNQEAARWEELSAQITQAAETIENEAIPQLQTQVQSSREQADTFRGRITEAQEEIGRLKADSPDCF